MQLLRWKKVVKDIVLPNGARVKVEINDAGTVQHVHDQDDRVHATARPPAAVLSLTGKPVERSPRVRQGFRYDDHVGLWAPLPT